MGYDRGAVYDIHDFCKELNGVDSFHRLETAKARQYLLKVIEYFTVEHGLALRDSTDPDNYKDLTLQDYWDGK